MRVLVVDDHLPLCELLTRALQRDGHVVQMAHTLEGAREALSDDVEAVVLDLGLPDGSGLALCRELRQDGNPVPVLVLTANNRVEERVEGLNAGADDFLGKPFALAELRARIRAIGRRRGTAVTLTRQLGQVFLDFGARRALRAQQDVPVTSREWCILEHLAAHDGRVASRDSLLEAVWDDRSDSAASSLEVLVGRIRRKLGDGVVRTVRGEGYGLGPR